MGTKSFYEGVSNFCFADWAPYMRGLGYELDYEQRSWEFTGGSERAGKPKDPLHIRESNMYWVRADLCTRRAAQREKQGLLHPSTPSARARLAVARCTRDHPCCDVGAQGWAWPSTAVYQ